MNFAIFKESDEMVLSGIPYPCTEPYGNSLDSHIMVDVYVGDKIFKVFIDDSGIQFLFHLTYDIFRKVFGD